MAGESTAWAQLSQSLDAVAKACMPTEQDVRTRRDLVARVDRALKNCSWLINGHIMPYGSYVSGIYNSTSDLDLAVTGQVHWEFLDRVSQRKLQEQNLASEQVPLHMLDKVAKGQVLRKVVNKLKEMHITSWDNLTFILHARVPIVKFKDVYTGVECDLSVGGDAQHVKAATLGLLRQVNCNLAPLYNVVKQWAKAHGMNDGTIGMFNSHCLSLLVVFYLQTCPDKALPPIYRLFYASRPPAESPRLLQPPYDPAEAEAALATATARMEGARQQHWKRGPDHTLADLLLNFVTFYVNLLERVLLQPDLGLRLSTWYGELQEGNGLTDYVLVVEEPMHNGDNPARTFGKRSEFPWMLHFVHDTFQRTQQVLQAVKDGSIVLPQAALAFLFGPHALIKPPLSRVLAEQFTSWPDWVHGRLHTDMATPGEVLHQMLEIWNTPASTWLPEACRHGPLTWKEEMMQQAKFAVRQERMAEGKTAARAAGRGARQPPDGASTAASTSTASTSLTAATASNSLMSAIAAAAGSVDAASGGVSVQLQVEAGTIDLEEAANGSSDKLKLRAPDNGGLDDAADEAVMLEQAAAAAAEAAMAAGASVAATMAGDVDQAEALDEIHAIAAAAGLLGCAAALKAATELARRRSARQAVKAAEKERKRQEQRRLDQQRQQQLQQNNPQRQGLEEASVNEPGQASKATPFAQGQPQQQKARDRVSQPPGLEYRQRPRQQTGGNQHAPSLPGSAPGASAGGMQLARNALQGLAVSNSAPGQAVDQTTGSAFSFPGSHQLGRSFASSSSGPGSVQSMARDAVQGTQDQSDSTGVRISQHRAGSSNDGAGHNGHMPEMGSSPPGGRGSWRGGRRGGRGGRGGRGRGRKDEGHE